MGFLKGKTIIIGVGGGIAVYRVCELARLLMKKGATVRVVMTKNAQEFVTPLTFQALTGNPVLTDLFDAERDAAFGHLITGHLADLYIVAPATANLIARIKAGMADDAVTTSLLAAKCKVLLAPAMNYAMWENEIAQENVKALRALPRFKMVGPVSGMLGEGVEGMGRQAEPIDIVDAAESVLAPKDLEGWKVVVTAGPTREHLDPVRFVSNPSSGRMGYEIARAAAKRGAKVVLVSGPCELPTPGGVDIVSVTSAEEMASAVISALRGAHLLVAAAAVSDQRPEKRFAQKVKKRDGPENIVFVRTPDIVSLARAEFPTDSDRPFFVGFAAETERVLENAREKLIKKKLDLIAANDITEAGSGFAQTTNHLTLIDSTGSVIDLPKQSKEDAANSLLDRVVELRQNDRRQEFCKLDATVS